MSLFEQCFRGYWGWGLSFPYPPWDTMGASSITFVIAGFQFRLDKRSYIKLCIHSLGSSETKILQFLPYLKEKQAEEYLLLKGYLFDAHFFIWVHLSNIISKVEKLSNFRNLLQFYVYGLYLHKITDNVIFTIT